MGIRTAGKLPSPASGLRRWLAILGEGSDAVAVVTCVLYDSALVDHHSCSVRVAVEILEA